MEPICIAILAHIKGPTYSYLNQESVSALPLLGRTEPGHTVCMQLRWQTPNGHNRIQSAMRPLEALEQLGILSLPTRERTLRDRQRPVVPGVSSDPHPEIGGPLAECGPLQVVAVRRRQTVGDWRELQAAHVGMWAARGWSPVWTHGCVRCSFAGAGSRWTSPGRKTLPPCLPGLTASREAQSPIWTGRVTIRISASVETAAEARST